MLVEILQQAGEAAAQAMPVAADTTTDAPSTASGAGWDAPLWLVALGLAGQACFFGRFLIQWVVSERKRRSVVPLVFWYLSIGGSILMIVYGFLRQDIVIVLGQTTGTIVYVRNLALLAAERAEREAGG